MEDGIYHPRRVISTNGNVFWIDKLTCDILDHDEQDSVKYHQHWKDS